MNTLFLLIALLIIFLVIISIAYMHALKKLTHCQLDYSELLESYYDKELECAELTCELNRLVELGAETSLTKNQKGGWTGPVTPESMDMIKKVLRN